MNTFTPGILQIVRAIAHLFLLAVLILVLHTGCLVTALSQDRGAAQKLLLSGIENANNGQMQKAIQQLTNAISLDPTFVEAYVSRGYAYYFAGNTDSALQDLDRAIQMDSLNANAYFYRGIILLAMNEYDRALRDLNTALRLDSINIEIFFARGQVKALLSDLPGAINDLTIYLAKEENDTLSKCKALVLRGQVYDSYGKTDEAISDFSSVISLAGGGDKEILIKALSRRGAALIDKEEYAKAMIDLNRILERSPHVARAWFNRGYIHRATEEYQKSIEDFTRAIEILSNKTNTTEETPDLLASAYHNRAGSWAVLDKYSIALKDRDSAVLLFPQRVEFRVDRAELRYVLKDYQGVLEDMDVLATLNFDPIRVYTFRALAYKELAEYTKALEECRLILSLEPSSAQTYSIKGDILVEMSRYTEALTNFDKAIELKGNSEPMYYVRRAIAHIKLNDFEAACRDTQHAIKTGTPAAEQLYEELVKNNHCQ